MNYNLGLENKELGVLENKGLDGLENKSRMKVEPELQESVVGFITLIDVTSLCW